MEGYLPPLHYGLSWIITSFTGDPIMTGHWVMLIQLLLTVGFVFAAVRGAVGAAPALFAVTWLLHTRHIMQRLTGGLPRGWAAPVLAAYLCCVLHGRGRGVLGVLLVGCFVHPPSTFLCGVSYGLYLLWKLARSDTRAASLPELKRAVIAAPFLLLAAWLVVKMPEELGTMASYERAASMPEFSRSGGRFPFVPLSPLLKEVRIFAFQAFTHRLYKIPFAVEIGVVIVASVMLVGLLVRDFVVRRAKERIALGPPLVTFLIGVVIVYLASRHLAFKLYVPDRHLQFPMGIFFVVAFSIGAWKAFHRDPARATDARWSLSKGSLFALVAVSLLIVTGSSHGLHGPANFNMTSAKLGTLDEWLIAETPSTALVAGHPTHMDGVPLFAKRRAYITTETAHPFYDRYYDEVRRRLDITLRAHYARSLEELVRLLEPEGVDYFVFHRKLFYPDALQKATYFRPFDRLVRELTNRPPDEYAYRQLPDQVDPNAAPYMPFKDASAAVVDVRKLSEFLSSRAVSPSGSSNVNSPS
jgi:hypothetical protein